MFNWSLLFWVVFSFLCGSLPFSVWVTRLGGADVRSVGDKNPGATNAFKAGGWKTGLFSLLLDVSKAALPVGLAYQIFHLQGYGMLLITIAPVLGHAFSPFLQFKGGKALATALGVWIGLTIWDVPLVALTGIVLWFVVLKNSGWAVLLSLTQMAIYIGFFRFEPLLMQTLALQSLLLLFKHRDDLRRLPAIQILKNQ